MMQLKNLLRHWVGKCGLIWTLEESHGDLDLSKICVVFEEVCILQTSMGIPRHPVSIIFGVSQ